MMCICGSNNWNDSYLGQQLERCGAKRAQWPSRFLVLKRVSGNFDRVLPCLVSTKYLPRRHDDRSMLCTQRPIRFRWLFGCGPNHDHRLAKFLVQQLAQYRWLGRSMHNVPKHWHFPKWLGSLVYFCRFSTHYATWRNRNRLSCIVRNGHSNYPNLCVQKKINESN